MKWLTNDSAGFILAWQQGVCFHVFRIFKRGSGGGHMGSCGNLACYGSCAEAFKQASHNRSVRCKGKQKTQYGGGKLRIF